MTRAVVALLALAACTVNTKTDKLACKVNADCDTGRICSEGYCIVGTPDAPGIDAAVCPPECASCDFPTGTCTMQGTGGTVMCPAGWNCHVTCTSAESCPQVACSSATSCNVTCTGDGACGAISCGLGACTVDCVGDGSSGSGSGSPACAAVSCTQSCKCDVSCGPSIDACGMMSCPTKPGNKYCGAGGAIGAPCDSNVFSQCRTCQ